LDKTILYKSLTIHYREEGEGFPVLLIHGMAEDSALWDTQTDHLANDYRLIVPDLPGSGQSSLIPGLPSVDELADAVRAICDQAGVGQCIMIGHSLGGYITLAFAEKYPGRLRAFGLFHSTAYADSDEKKLNRRKMIDFIRKNGSPAFVRQSFPNLLADGTRKDRPAILNGLIDRYSGFQPESLVYYQEAMIRRPDRVTVLQNFTGPVLFVIGEQDKTVPPEHSLQQCHIPVISHVHILEKAAHMGMLEDGVRSSRVLRSFINFTLHS
jgi:pimeloyl-ACP methyl ester carboxylesterase